MDISYQSSTFPVQQIPPPLGHVPPPRPSRPPPIGHRPPLPICFFPPQVSPYYQYYANYTSTTQPSVSAAVPLYLPSWAVSQTTNQTTSKLENETRSQTTVKENLEQTESVEIDKQKLLTTSEPDSISEESGSNCDEQTNQLKPVKMNLKRGLNPIKLKPQIIGTKKQKLDSKPSQTVSAAFGSDSEEEEEMPKEAKLRMRNIGKDTPTSAGPNCFSKS